MELFRKPLINITTIFITVLVSFGLVRLLNLSAEWQGIMLAIVATALFLIIQHVMQRPGPKPAVGPVADSTKILFGKLQQQLAGISAKYYVYQPTSKCYVDIDSGQVLLTSHPVILVLGKKPTLTLVDLDTATIPDIYVEDITTLLTRLGQHLYAVTPSQQDQPLALVFTDQPLSDKQQTWLQHDFGTLLSLDLNQNFQLQGNTSVLTKDNKYPTMLYVFVGLFVLFTAWFVWNDALMTFGLTKVSHVYGITALIAAIYGLSVAGRWKKFANIANTLRWLVIGLFLQVLGQISYTYYSVFLGIETPYPSFGDIGYFGSVIVYLVASIYLARSFGFSFKKAQRSEVVQLIVCLLIVYLSAHFLFFRNYELDFSYPLRVFLDFAYPLFQGLYVAIAFVTFLRARATQSMLGQKTILILAALAWQFLCDYIFIYQAYAGTWQGGGFNDYMYFLSYLMFGLVMVAFGKKEYVH